jgi:dicarboxylate transporter 10
VTRFGVYEFSKGRIQANGGLFPYWYARCRTQQYTSALSFTCRQKCVVALIAGALGGVAGCPADVCNVRMQADSMLPIEQRRNYRNAFDGIVRITRNEGVSRLFSGTGPMAVRAAILNAAQVASYDQIKEFLVSLGMPDRVPTHLTAGTLASFAATAASMVCTPARCTRAVCFAH